MLASLKGKIVSSYKNELVQFAELNEDAFCKMVILPLYGLTV